jgi:hypothetical protein
MYQQAGVTGLKMGRQNADPLVGLPSQTQRNYTAAGTKKIDMKTFRFRKRLDTNHEFNHYSMYVKGFILDTVKEVKAASLNGSIPSDWAEFGAWYEAPDGLVPDDFWRTLVADRGRDGKNPPVYYSRACKESFEKGSFVSGTVNTSDLINNERCSVVAQFCRRVQAVIWNRALIHTETYKLGLVDKEVKKGDKVCILYGCSVPVILRPSRPKSEDDFINDIEWEKLYLVKQLSLCWKNYCGKINALLQRIKDQNKIYKIWEKERMKQFRKDLEYHKNWPSKRVQQQKAFRERFRNDQNKRELRDHKKQKPELVIFYLNLYRPNFQNLEWLNYDEATELKREKEEMDKLETEHEELRRTLVNNFKGKREPRKRYQEHLSKMLEVFLSQYKSWKYDKKEAWKEWKMEKQEAKEREQKRQEEKKREEERYQSSGAQGQYNRPQVQPNGAHSQQSVDPRSEWDEPKVDWREFQLRLKYFRRWKKKTRERKKADRQKLEDWVDSLMSRHWSELNEWRGTELTSHKKPQALFPNNMASKETRREPTESIDSERVEGTLSGSHDEPKVNDGLNKPPLDLSTTEDGPHQPVHMGEMPTQSENTISARAQSLNPGNRSTQLGSKQTPSDKVKPLNGTSRSESTAKNHVPSENPSASDFLNDGPSILEDQNPTLNKRRIQRRVNPKQKGIELTPKQKERLSDQAKLEYDNILQKNLRKRLGGELPFKDKKSEGKAESRDRRDTEDSQSNRHSAEEMKHPTGYYYYELLGECYIHGMMDGEAMAFQNRKEIPATVFEIR